MDKPKNEINSLCRIRVNKMLSTLAQKSTMSKYTYSQSNKNLNSSNRFTKLSNSKSFNKKKRITNNLSKKTVAKPSIIVDENYKKQPVDFIINHGLVIYAKNFEGDEIVNFGLSNKNIAKNNFQTHTTNPKIYKNNSNNNLLNKKFSKKSIIKSSESKLSSIRSEKFKSPIHFNDNCYTSFFNFYQNINNKKLVNSKKKHKKHNTIIDSINIEDNSISSIPFNNNKLKISEKSNKKMQANIDNNNSRNNNFMKTSKEKNSNSKNSKISKTNKELKINTKNLYGGEKVIKNIIYTKVKNSEKNIFPYYRANKQDCVNEKDKEEESTNTNNTNTNNVRSTNPNTIQGTKQNLYVETNSTNIFTTENGIINVNNKIFSYKTILKFLNHLTSYIIHYLKQDYLLIKNFSKKNNTTAAKKNSYFFETESVSNIYQNVNISNLGSQLSIELNDGNKLNFNKIFNTSTLRNTKQKPSVNCSSLVSLIGKKYRFLSRDQKNDGNKKSELFRDSNELSKKMLQINNRKKKRNLTSNNNENRNDRLILDNFDMVNSDITSPEKIDRNYISEGYSFSSFNNMSNFNDGNHNYKMIFLKTREKLRKIRESQKKQNDIKMNNINKGRIPIQKKISQKILIRKNKSYMDYSNNIDLEILSNIREKNKNKKNKFITERKEKNSEKFDNENSDKDKNTTIRIKNITTKDKRISININYLFLNFSYAKTKPKKFNDLYLVIVKNVLYNYIGIIIHNKRKQKNAKKNSKDSNIQIYKRLSLIKEEEELDKNFSKSIKNSVFFEDFEKIKKLINLISSLNYILLEKKFFFRIKLISFTMILQKIFNKKYYYIFFASINYKGKKNNKNVYYRKLGKGGKMCIKRKTSSLNKIERNTNAMSFDHVVKSKDKLNKIKKSQNNNLKNDNSYNQLIVIPIEKYLKFKYKLISFILNKK